MYYVIIDTEFFSLFFRIFIGLLQRHDNIYMTTNFVPFVLKLPPDVSPRAPRETNARASESV